MSTTDDVPSGDEAHGSDETEAEIAVLNCLLCEEHPQPWTVEEIAREMGSALAATDAVMRLTSSGLLHRSGEFVFPTRAARRAAELQLGTL